MNNESKPTALDFSSSMINEEEIKGAVHDRYDMVGAHIKSRIPSFDITRVSNNESNGINSIMNEHFLTPCLPGLNTQPNDESEILDLELNEKNVCITHHIGYNSHIIHSVKGPHPRDINFNGYNTLGTNTSQHKEASFLRRNCSEYHKERALDTSMCEGSLKSEPQEYRSVAAPKFTGITPSKLRNKSSRRPLDIISALFNPKESMGKKHVEVLPRRQLLRKEDEEEINRVVTDWERSKDDTLIRSGQGSLFLNNNTSKSSFYDDNNLTERFHAEIDEDEDTKNSINRHQPSNKKKAGEFCRNFEENNVSEVSGNAFENKGSSHKTIVNQTVKVKKTKSKTSSKKTEEDRENVGDFNKVELCQRIPKFHKENMCESSGNPAENNLTFRNELIKPTIPAKQAISNPMMDVKEQDTENVGDLDEDKLCHTISYIHMENACEVSGNASENKTGCEHGVLDNQKLVEEQTQPNRKNYGNQKLVEILGDMDEVGHCQNIPNIQEKKVYDVPGFTAENKGRCGNGLNKQYTGAKLTATTIHENEKDAQRIDDLHKMEKHCQKMQIKDVLKCNQSVAGKKVTRKNRNKNIIEKKATPNTTNEGYDKDAENSGNLDRVSNAAVEICQLVQTKTVKKPRKNLIERKGNHEKGKRKRNSFKKQNTRMSRKSNRKGAVVKRCKDAEYTTKNVSKRQSDLISEINLRNCPSIMRFDQAKRKESLLIKNKYILRKEDKCPEKECLAIVGFQKANEALEDVKVCKSDEDLDKRLEDESSGSDDIMFEFDEKEEAKIIKSCTFPRKQSRLHKIYKKLDINDIPVLLPALSVQHLRSNLPQLSHVFEKIHHDASEVKESYDDLFPRSSSIHANHVRIIYLAMIAKAESGDYEGAKKVCEDAIRDLTAVTSKALKLCDESKASCRDDEEKDDEALSMKLAVGGLWCVLAHFTLNVGTVQDSMQKNHEYEIHESDSDDNVLSTIATRRRMNDNCSVSRAIKKKRRKISRKREMVKDFFSSEAIEKGSFILEKATSCPIASDAAWVWIAKARLYERKAVSNVAARFAALHENHSVENEYFCLNMLKDSVLVARRICDEALIVPDFFFTNESSCHTTIGRRGVLDSEGRKMLCRELNRFIKYENCLNPKSESSITQHPIAHKNRGSINDTVKARYEAKDIVEEVVWVDENVLYSTPKDTAIPVTLNTEGKEEKYISCGKKISEAQVMKEIGQSEYSKRETLNDDDDDGNLVNQDYTIRHCAKNENINQTKNLYDSYTTKNEDKDLSCCIRNQGKKSEQINSVRDLMQKDEKIDLEGTQKHNMGKLQKLEQNEDTKMTAMDLRNKMQYDINNVIGCKNSAHQIEEAKNTETMVRGNNKDNIIIMGLNNIREVTVNENGCNKIKNKKSAKSSVKDDAQAQRNTGHKPNHIHLNVNTRTAINSSDEKNQLRTSKCMIESYKNEVPGDSLLSNEEWACSTCHQLFIDEENLKKHKTNCKQISLEFLDSYSSDTMHINRCNDKMGKHSRQKSCNIINKTETKYTPINAAPTRKKMRFAIPHSASSLDIFLEFVKVIRVGKEDLHHSSNGKMRPLFEGQVGFQCAHCSGDKSHIIYPQSITKAYKAVWHLCLFHIDSCNAIPTEKKRLYDVMRDSYIPYSGNEKAVNTWFMDLALKQEMKDWVGGVMLMRSDEGEMNW